MLIKSKRNNKNSSASNKKEVNKIIIRKKNEEKAEIVSNNKGGPILGFLKRVSVLNLLLTMVLLLAITFSIFQFVKATTPNPGHPWTDVGDGIWQATGTTALRTFIFPDFNAEILTSSSSIIFAQRTATVTTTLSAATDTVLLADGTSQAFAVNLPTAVGNNGTVFTIKKIDTSLTNIITIQPNGTETIDSLNNVTLANRGETIIIQSDGVGWRTLSRRSYDVSGYRTRGATLNQWYSSPNSGTALTTGAPTVNNLRAIPFVVSKSMTVDQMAINVTTAGSGGTGSARVGIYADNGNSYPGALIVDAGTAVTTATGVKTFTTGLPVTLDPGLYWLVYVHDNSTTAPTIRSFAVASLTPVLGYASTLPTNAQFGWAVAFTFAALPATYPTGGTTITAVPIPAIFVRTSQ